MVDTVDSKSAARKGVWVRLPPWVQVIVHQYNGLQLLGDNTQSAHYLGKVDTEPRPITNINR